MTLFAQAGPVTLHHGDVLDVLADLPDGCVDAVVTSPPYLGLRDYGVPPTDWPQVEYVPMTGLPAVTVPAMTCVLGLESEPLAYVAHLVVIFREIRRVLALDGVCWLNLGDSYSMDSKWGGATGGRHAKALHGSPGGTRGRRRTGLPDKNLIGTPWRAAMALQGDGWVLRNDLIWDKPNAMPSPVRDRLSSTHEHVFLLARSPRYFFDLDAIREPLAYPDAANGSRVFGGRRKAVSNAFLNASERTRGRAYVRSHPGGKNPGDVWSISTSAFPQAHHATMSPRLADRLVVSACPRWHCPAACGPTSTDCGHGGRRPGVVLDPFSGAGTTGMTAIATGREYVGIDASGANLDLSLRTRLAEAVADSASD